MAEEKKELIKIRGANEHNLKNLDVDIPRNKLTQDSSLGRWRSRM